MARIFISYASKDQKQRAYVKEHLAILSRHHNLDFWSDQDIPAGDDWRPRLEKELNRANAAVLLVSRHFLGSDFIQTVEAPHLLRRRAREGLPVWPLLLSACAWESVPWLASLQLRPRGAKPLWSMTLAKRDEAMAAFAAEIHSKLTPTPGSKVIVTSELVLKTDLADFGEADRADIASLLRDVLPDGDKIVIKRLKPGSTRVFVEMTEAQLAKLKRLVDDGFFEKSVFELRGPLNEVERRGLELFEFRGKLVVRDETVAALFGTRTKVLNQAVTRNAERFDDDHAFVLTQKEWSALRSQLVTAKTGRGGRTNPPRMFTEAGVVMSGTVLRSPQAVEAAKMLVQVFLEARRARANSLAGKGGEAMLDALKVFDTTDTEPLPASRRRRPKR